MKQNLLYIFLLLLLFSTETQAKPKPPQPTHRVLAGIGVGYGEVCRYGSVATQGDVSYAYFWNDHWGVSAGLGLDYYRSHHAYSQDYSIQGYIDTDHEPMTVLQISEQNMLQDSRMLVANIPLMLQMEYRLSKRRKAYPACLYGALGMRFGVPVSHMQTTTGDITQSGYYPKWQLNIQGYHEYGTTSVNNRQSFPVYTPTFTPQAELGVTLPVSQQTAIGVGFYGNVSAWNATGYLPWQVGIKVSVRWKKVIERKPQPQPQPEPQPEPAKPAQPVQPVQPEPQPVQPEPQPQPQPQPEPEVEQLVVMPDTSVRVITFLLNSVTPTASTLPAIDEAAAILVANPNLHAEVNGHACHQGSYAYNEALSRRRAQAVADLLLQRGVREQQITIHAYSYSAPADAKPHDPALDRRVEIVFIDNQ